MEIWEGFKEWFLSLGTKYNVNPYIFGFIYVGAIPFFLLGLGRTAKNIKAKKPYLLPLLFTGFCFISANLYLLFAGRNLPTLVYIFIAVMIGYAVYYIAKKIKSKIHS